MHTLDVCALLFCSKRATQYAHTSILKSFFRIFFRNPAPDHITRLREAVPSSRSFFSRKKKNPLSLLLSRLGAFSYFRAFNHFLSIFCYTHTHTLTHSHTHTHTHPPTHTHTPQPNGKQVQQEVGHCLIRHPACSRSFKGHFICTPTDQVAEPLPCKAL
jgi:hypothetical protein